MGAIQSKGLRIQSMVLKNRVRKCSSKRYTNSMTSMMIACGGGSQIYREIFIQTLKFCKLLNSLTQFLRKKSLYPEIEEKSKTTTRRCHGKIDCPLFFHLNFTDSMLVYTSVIYEKSFFFLYFSILSEGRKHFFYFKSCPLIYYLIKQLMI